MSSRTPARSRASSTWPTVQSTCATNSRLLPLLRKAFPRARFLVRLDGGFASPAVFDFLEAQPRLEYVVAMAKNAVLERHAEPAMLVARARSWCSEQTEHVYTDTDEYRAGTWKHARRVVIKAEVVRLGDREPRDNPRFVVTNLRQTPRFIYEKVYCARGDVENRIKELKALQIDRTSCQDFSANQLRVLLTAAAYVLMQELRLCAAGTACARALAARPAAQARRPGGALGASHRPPPAARDAGPSGTSRSHSEHAPDSRLARGTSLTAGGCRPPPRGKCALHSLRHTSIGRSTTQLNYNQMEYKVCSRCLSAIDSFIL